jgi:folate-binding protein YgfZ
MVPDRDDASLKPAASPPPPPPPPPPASPVARLDPGDVAASLLPALETGAVLARAPVAVVALAGPGAVTCMQGLLTNDVEHPGDGAFVYGALLTPKGMIVVDGWAARLGTTVSYTVPGIGRERALGVFTRSVPPRLARVSDRTSEVAVYRLLGPAATPAATAAGLPVPPAPGRVLAASGIETARPPEGAPFALQITAPAAQAARIVAALTAAGAVEASPAVLELARILAGWPALGAEVDDKTIPQEVRYDAIGGVSYTKGCYTGQETVARLHFRGHTNRELRGLLFDAEPPAAPAAPAAGWTAVTALDREVGRVTSLAFVPDTGAPGAGTWIGLALVRREVAPGAMVRAAGRDARVVDLPFTLPVARPA